MRSGVGSEKREAFEPRSLQWRGPALRGIRYRCHIYRATAEALSEGRKVHDHAEGTDRYRTLEGRCLLN